MHALIRQAITSHTPESLLEKLQGEPGLVLLRSFMLEMSQARYSFIAARPFLTFRSDGSRCETRWAGGCQLQFGDPWRLLEALISRYELLDEIDLPFPLGGCFGYWGYDLKNFIESRLPRRAISDLELPDCHLGFYDSLVAFDHHFGTTWVLATGLQADGSRSEERARQQCDFWMAQLAGPGVGSDAVRAGSSRLVSSAGSEQNQALSRSGFELLLPDRPDRAGSVFSNFAQIDFLNCVERARKYIHAGDIYQVNLSQRLTAACPLPAWDFFKALGHVSPAPLSAYLDAGEFQVASSSPELFLRMNGSRVLTRPIKGTRPRSPDPTRDSQLSYQLQTSPKEMAELVMITDLLRNDLGKVCEFGSVQVPELARLERFPQVQHLVSTVEGFLRKEVSHLGALAACFPGGSITGAPKIRAMQIIDELEPVSRGPYTGAMGYLGFNRESQLSILIRTALCKNGLVHFQVGAGIVADSIPSAEYLETLAKARGFFEALHFCSQLNDRIPQRQIPS
jgi:para-aminobenzoate synthetase component 1